MLYFEKPSHKRWLLPSSQKEMQRVRSHVFFNHQQDLHLDVFKRPGDVSRKNPDEKKKTHIKKHNIASKVTILADGHSIASDSCSKASVLLLN